MTEKVQEHRIVDSSTTAINKLGFQLGSSENFLVEGLLDERKLSNITQRQAVWMSHFLLIDDDKGGEYSVNFVEQMLVLLQSIEGTRAKQIVEALKNISHSGPQQLKEDKRGLIGRILNRPFKD